MMTWRGTACIYQGEELGLRQADVVFEDLQDPYGIEFWPEYKGRDGCRTPMVWENNNQNGGFSTGTPWLPVSPDHLQKAPTEQDGLSSGLLDHYKAAIALRHTHEAFAKGTHADMRQDGDVLSFTRKHDGDTYFCVFNMSDDPASVALPAGKWANVGQNVGGVEPNAGKATLSPWQVCLVQQQN